MTPFNDLSAGPSRLIRKGDDQYLYFGGTAYLGISQDNDFKALFMEGIDQFGINTGTSRGNNIQLAIFNEAETVAARRFGSEAALTVSSGYLAAQLAIREFSSFGKLIYAPGTHPALWLSEKPDVAGGFGEWIDETVAFINRSDEERFVIVSDSLNSLRPERYDFSSLKQIATEKEVIVIIDDSHGLGVIGEEGKGIFSLLPVQDNIHRIVVASMAKGLGIDGGLVLGGSDWIAQLKKTQMFNGASPPAPAALYAFIQGREIYARQWKKLQRNVDFMGTNLPEGIHYAKGFPAYYAENPDLYERLLKVGIVISSFSYPQAHDPLLNRIIVSSWHHEDDLQFLLNHLS